MILNMFWASRKVPVILVIFKLNLGFLEKVSKNTQISSFIKIRPVGTDSFSCGQADGRTDRRADMRKLIVAFRSFSNTPRK